jgi:hypothetical protein
MIGKRTNELTVYKNQQFVGRVGGALLPYRDQPEQENLQLWFRHAPQKTFGATRPPLPENIQLSKEKGLLTS